MTFSSSPLILNKQRLFVLLFSFFKKHHLLSNKNIEYTEMGCFFCKAHPKAYFLLSVYISSCSSNASSQVKQSRLRSSRKVRIRRTQKPRPLSKAWPRLLNLFVMRRKPSTRSWSMTSTCSSMTRYIPLWIKYVSEEFFSSVSWKRNSTLTEHELLMVECSLAEM